MDTTPHFAPVRELTPVSDFALNFSYEQYKIHHVLLLMPNSCTVQTFNPCTSRPGVCQCLVVQTPMDNMSKEVSQTHQ